MKAVKSHLRDLKVMYLIAYNHNDSERMNAIDREVNSGKWAKSTVSKWERSVLKYIEAKKRNEAILKGVIVR